jgi:pimeloyl-ACP methyl ester carboxylesterase
VLGGIGRRANRGNPLTPERRAGIADAEERGAAEDASARAFRSFAERTGADRAALAAFQRAETPITRARLADFRVPTLVIAGDDDTLAGSAHLLADRIPGAVAKTITGTHLGAVMDPEFTRSIVEFVTGAAVVS